MSRTTADERQADVIVVGAGPAGSTAAYHLTRSGLDVLLLEVADPEQVPRRLGADGHAGPPFDSSITRSIPSISSSSTRTLSVSAVGRFLPT